MGQKQPGPDDRRLSTSSSTVMGSRGKSMKLLPIVNDDINGTNTSTSFTRRIPRNTTYDDVAFKVKLVFDDVKNFDKLEKFLKSGGDVNYVPHVYGLYDWTLLHWAAFYKVTNSVKALVTKGANVNLKTSDGEVPAKIAKSVGANAEILRLLEAGRLLGGN
jgi:ankyrin repeat protein